MKRKQYATCFPRLKAKLSSDVGYFPMNTIIKSIIPHVEKWKQAVRRAAHLTGQSTREMWVAATEIPLCRG